MSGSLAYAREPGNYELGANKEEMLQDKLKNIELSYLYRRSWELGSNDPKFIALGMCGALLFELYGREWMSKRILTRKNMSFLIPGSHETLDEFRLQNRIVTLAEGLYNLKEIEGLDGVLEKLRSENIDSVIAEIESGRLLRHRGLNFKYVTRTFKKREDFDIQIIHGSMEIFCETKCKIETTRFSEASFINSLNKAKQQLPLNCPAIILIKIPDKWVKHKNRLKRNTKIFVEKADRPVGVVCWFEQWIQMDEVFTMRVITGFEEHNTKSEILNSQIIPFLPGTTQTPGWISFERFATGYL